MRQGVIQTVLNTIIALVGVGIVFSASFFVYENVIQAVSGPKVLEGFESFIKPIASACNGDNSFATGLTLPTQSQYTYGVVQTRLRESDLRANPLMRNACTDSYCLCLFRIPKGNYDSWKITPEQTSNLVEDYQVTVEGANGELIVDEPAPLWHFNSPGVEVVPHMIKRMIRLTIQELMAKLVTRIVSDLAATTICCSVDSTKLGCIACFALVTAISQAVFDYITTLTLVYQREATEPILAINYPSNFMTNSDVEKLYWTSDSGIFDCDLLARWGPDEIRLDIQQAMLAAQEAAIEGFLEGFARGLTKGVSKYLKATDAGFATKFLAKAAAGTTRVGLNALTIYQRLTTGRVVNAVRNFETTPENLNPDCYVLDLLSARVSVDLAKWVDSGKEYIGYVDVETVDPDDLDAAVSEQIANAGIAEETEFDEDVFNMNNLDIINCVSISDLGPLCDDETKVLIDYAYDWYYYYKLLDPVNDFQKSLFCELMQKSGEYEASTATNVVDTLLGKIGLGGAGDLKNAIRTVIVDLYLGGKESINGMMMECGYPAFVRSYESQYFQYWIPYFDAQGIMGYDGQIPYLTADLVDNTEQEAITCRETYANLMSACYAESSGVADCFGNCRQCHVNCNAENYPGCTQDDIECCCEADTNCDYGACDSLTLSVNGMEAEINVFNYDGCEVIVSEEGTDLNIPGDFNTWEEYYSSINLVFNTDSVTSYNKQKCDVCYENFYDDYVACTPGVHLTLGGVLI